MAHKLADVDGHLGSLKFEIVCLQKDRQYKRRTRDTCGVYLALIDIDLDKYEIKQPSDDVEVTAAMALVGKATPPMQHLFLYSADEWEVFLEEWAHCQKGVYHKVVNLGGSSDYGIDIAGFCTDKGFEGDWDNYQCKYYKGAALTPGTAIPEIGKLLWHVHEKKITLPRKYYFFAPKDCGPSLKKLLLNPEKLKNELLSKWDDWCTESITTTQTVELVGTFAALVDTVDFSIFQYKPVLEVIEELQGTRFFIPRFGGGFPDRPASKTPPELPLEKESRYLSQLYEAYSDKEKMPIETTNLADHPKLEQHFERQREAFFHAESLDVFSRDTVPHGTFASLQKEVHSGVVDVCQSAHPNGFERLGEVVKTANTLSLTANGLIQVTKLEDRRGICHQLANMDELVWVPDDE